jgi:hypothetical protein
MANPLGPKRTAIQAAADNEKKLTRQKKDAKTNGSAWAEPTPLVEP